MMRTTATTILLAVVPLIAVTPASAAKPTFFQAPSANIGCALSATGARCDIGRRDWSPPPKPGWCPGEWGNGLTIGMRGRARISCAGDSVLGAGRRLRYGKSIQRGRFRCTSRKAGMRCVNRRNGHGFRLSRQVARRF